MPGYSVLARVMGKRRELGIFRRFSTLSCQNLLCMQAELLDLELQLREMVHDPEISVLDQSWSTLNSEYNEIDAKVWREKFLELRQKLDTYYQALLQAAQINQLEQPRKYDFDFLHKWLNHPCGGDYFLRGIEAESFEPHKLADMVVLSGKSEPGDSLAEYICTKVVPIYHRIFGYRLNQSMNEEDFEEAWEYKKGIFVGLGNAFCMLLSASVPAISILVLYFVNSMVARLAVIAVMSFVFSLLMTFVVRESRGSVFAATTAFAALQVVFVGGTNVIGAT